MYVIKQLLVGLALGVVVTGVVIAAPKCEVTIHSNDQISWDKPTLEVSKSCETFTVTLVDTGKLDKGVMGHNWVLTREQDRDAVAKAVIMAKADDYIKEDSRIIAHSSLVGGGEQTSITFNVGDLVEGQQYSYFCSYPEHTDLMYGTLQLVD